jgi:uncharacterized protein YukE
MDCATRFEELTHERDVVLDEDLAALQRLPERTRIERYNEIKGKEESFVWEFGQECPEFLTDAETDHVRGQFRLARLLIAASFYADDGDTLPRAMSDDFVAAELQAVVDFDRYKQFDALTESQIEGKIRRMEGEVYDLVTEYTSTQIADMDDLIENPDVQQDLIERLVDRYEERREKIRHGFFVYVETHGLEHMVEAIEEAVTAVTDAAEEREQIQAELRSELDDLAETVDERLDRQHRDIEAELQDIEGQLASQGVDPETLRAELERVTTATGSPDAGESDDGADPVSAELGARIERTTELGERLEVQIDDLEAVRETAREAAADELREEAVALVEDELEELTDQREEIRTAVERLEREREQVEAEREALEARQQTLEQRVDEVEQSFDGEGGVEGEDAVTATMARVLELDYLGRFDISMTEAETIRTRDGEFDVPEGYWDGRSERRSERATVVSLLDGGDPEEYPTNALSRYEITAGRYLGLSSTTETLIEARVLADLEAFAANGFDASPATLDDLLSVVNEAVYAAEEGDHGYLLSVASPTGWSDRVREQVASADLARSRYSERVSLCLVDLQDGSLVYDDSDPVVRENADLFAPPVDDERVAACIDLVRREYVDDVAHESVLLTDVADDHGFDAPVVKRAFNRLEDEGAGEQLYLDELGLSLECGT